MQKFHEFITCDVYVWLNMFRAPLRPSSGAYNCTRSLWFYRWRVAVGALLVVVLNYIISLSQNYSDTKILRRGNGGLEIYMERR
jgi:hypothetical protein